MALGKITECHTRVLNERPKANDDLFHACKHGFQPVPSYLGHAALLADEVLPGAGSEGLTLVHISQLNLSCVCHTLNGTTKRIPGC